MWSSRSTELSVRLSNRSVGWLYLLRAVAAGADKPRYICKVQTVLGDNKCQELWYLLQQARKADTVTAHDTIRYRREAERNVTDEKLYRLDWVGRGSVVCRRERGLTVAYGR